MTAPDYVTARVWMKGGCLLDRALYRIAWVASAHRGFGWLAIAAGRFRLRLLGVEWMKGWSLWQLWRL